MKTLAGLFYSLLLCCTFFNGNCQTELWGVTLVGGAYNEGAVIHISSTGTSLTVAHSFQGPAGYEPYGNLLQASDGNLYGTCYNGGAFGSCTLYKLNPMNNSYTDVHSFNGSTGFIPYSGVIQGSNGILYGVTATGGTNGDGVLYSYDINTNVYTDVHDFIDSSGRYPYGTPVMHSNGYLYGLTVFGGINDMGVIYRFDISTNSYVQVLNFIGVNGKYPFVTLMEANNGTLYGMTNEGGTNNVGVLFSYDPALNYYIKLFDFDGTNGKYPRGSLMQATDGYLYGTTAQGGSANQGVIFKYNIITNTFTNLYNFNASDGDEPHCNLTQLGSELFGMTRYGGTSGDGVIFKFDITSNTYTKLIDLNGTNGQNPSGGFIQLTPTGIGFHNLNSSALTFFSNPATTTITISPGSMAAEKNLQFTLYDMQGRVMLQQQFEASKPIDVSALPRGMYVAVLKGKEKEVRGKVAVE